MAGSPERAESPSRSSRTKDLITRFGPNTRSAVSFAKEERFAWQKAKFQSDVVYDVTPGYSGRTVRFPGALRTSLDENPDAKKRSTGPGSYDIQDAPNHLSEYRFKGGQRFATGTRESMVMKTPSPGAVYNIGNCYANGPDKTEPISFNCDTRPALYNTQGSDADMLWPALPKGRSITIAKRIKRKDKNIDTPGAIYNIRQGWKTGPSFSFGKGRGDRFSSFGILKGFES